MGIEIVIAAALLVALIFLATIDAAFSQLSDVGLRRISSDDPSTETKKSAVFLREILENRARFRFALSSAIQILLIVFTVLITVVAAVLFSDRMTLLVVSILTVVAATVVLRQVVPRLLVRSNTERKLLFLLPAIRPMYRLVSVFAEPRKGTHSRMMERLEATGTPESAESKDDDNNEDFQALIEVGEAEGIIEERERELIETVVEFSETRVGEIMTPRTEICAVSVDSTIRAARDLVIDEKYSRMPVYRDSIDNIEGVIYVRDLLQSWADGTEDTKVSEILRAPYFVPETKTASDLLKSMQADHIQFAVVIDEYGGVAGVVTVEDILEELVGEIEDEDTTQEEIVEMIQGDGGHWDVAGSTEIDKIERVFNIELEDDEYSTIAGLVTSEAGYVPKIGEHLTLRGLDIEILEAEEKRINKMRLTRSANVGNVEMSDAA